jgi:hypothetical protein
MRDFITEKIIKTDHHSWDVTVVNIL